jgi:hypothetical protein
MQIDLAELAYAQWQAEEELEQQRNVLLARDYFEGDVELPLTDRQLLYLGYRKSDNQFSMNFCRPVVKAVYERLIVKGFDSADKTFSGWATSLWQANRMDSISSDVALAAVRDGETFVIVSWDADEKRLIFTPHERFTDPQVEGSGYGCRAIYPDNDPSQPMKCAVKRWTETTGVGYNADAGGSRQTRQRMTVYYPDRLERYAMGKGGEWEPYQEDRQSFPTPWRDQNQKPLGIPVVHFRNSGGNSELWDAIPIQDAIHKSALDLLAAQDTAGFPLLIARGFNLTTDGAIPASDGSNLLKLAPGSWIGTPDAAQDVRRLEGADLDKMLRVVDSLIIKLAQVTDTPVNRFQMTGQIAAAETLKQQDSPLLAKVRSRQSKFGDAWEDCLYMARKLANLYGGAGLNEDSLIETQWEPAEARDETAEIERLAVKAEKLGIPKRQIWKEAGYNDAQIEAMLAEPEISQGRTSAELQALELQQAKAAMTVQERTLPEVLNAGRGGGAPVQ